MEEILAYGVMALLIVVIAIFVFAMVKALLKTLIVAGVCVALWFAAVELFPEQTSMIRAEVATIMSTLLDDFSSKQMMSGSSGILPTSHSDEASEAGIEDRD